MRNLWLMTRKEFHSYFISPIAYIVITSFLVLNGYIFWIIIQVMNDPGVPAGADAMKLFFGGTFFFWLLKLFIIPAITMRSISEEKRSGTFEVLMTAPVTDLQVVLSKYLAALLFYLLLWFLTILYVAILRHYSVFDLMPICAGYLGTALLGAYFCSIGIFASSTTKSQIVAAIISFAVLVIIFSIGLFQYIVHDSLTRDVFAYLNVWEHMQEFSKGIVDSRRIVYYCSMTLFFLFLTIRSVESRQWR